MRIVKLKRITASAMSLVLVLSLFGCGKKEVKIDDYGSNESENISSYTDASQVDGEGQTLGQLFGTKVKWDDTFAVQGVNTKSKLTIDIPEGDYLNVYKVKGVSDGLDDEERIVKQIFGDSAEKLEEIKYTNATDYITLLYKYRSLVHEFNGDIYNYFTSPESYKEIMGSINSEFSETYKWEDEKDHYIHMYEGKYNGIRYGLILAYNYNTGGRYIFLDPISIKDYFPEADYKTMVYEENFDTIQKIKDVESECTKSVDEAEKEARKFMSDVVGLNDNDNIIDKKPGIYHNFNGLALYPSTHNDGGPMMLTFSDADYVSTLQNGDCGSQARGISRLAEQEELAVEGMETTNNDYYSFLRQYNSTGTVEPKLARKGYALYLQCATSQAIENDDTYYMSLGNTGVVKVTDKGIYGVDLVIYNETIDVVENVRLLDFEKIKESAKNALEEKLKLDKMGNPDELIIAAGALLYEPCYDEENDNDEYSYIPVWKFFVSSSNVEAGASGMIGSVDLSINAMDGSVNQFDQVDPETGMVYNGDGVGYQSIEVSDGEDEE